MRMYVGVCVLIIITEYMQNKKVKLATLVEGDPKAPFSIADTLRCREGRYSIS